MKQLIIFLGATIVLSSLLSFKFSQNVDLRQNVCLNETNGYTQQFYKEVDAEIAKFAEIYIKNTENVMHAINKWHLVSGKTEKSQELLSAVKLHDYSKLLLNAKDFQQAIICSSKSRDLGIKLLENADGKETASHYIRFENEPVSYLERYTDKDQSTLEDWLKRVKLN